MVRDFGTATTPPSSPAAAGTSDFAFYIDFPYLTMAEPEPAPAGDEENTGNEATRTAKRRRIAVACGSCRSRKSKVQSNLICVICDVYR
jgi:hypothetical protein